jgi:hypothetical protein
MAVGENPNRLACLNNRRAMGPVMQLGRSTSEIPRLKPAWALTARFGGCRVASRSRTSQRFREFSLQHFVLPMIPVLQARRSAIVPALVRSPSRVPI